MSRPPHSAPDDARASLRRIANLRDLGGLPTRCGEFSVKPRCFFRSGAPAGLGPDEQRALASLNLRTAIDLRTSAEVHRAGGDSYAAGVQSVSLPLFKTARRNWIRPAEQSPKATAARYLEMTDDGRRAIAAVVARIARPNAAPLVVYCAAGRDRTGLVVACVLDLLDIAEDAIAADYGASDPFDPAGGRAHQATIRKWFALVRDRHGSVGRMLSGHGVTEGMSLALRRNLLIPRDS
jgi:protein-tyrosine phosphatase